MADLAQDALNSAKAAALSDLIEKRSRIAMYVGICAYSTNIIDPWFLYHNLTVLHVHLTTILVICCLTAYSYSPWGIHQKLGILTIGYLLTVGGFELNVYYANAFNTIYSDGFPTFFAFYCVLIPISVPRTAFVGLLTFVILSIPELFGKGQVSLLGTAISAWTSFAVLLVGRYIANRLWAEEFVSSRRLAEASQRNLDLSRKHSDFVIDLSHDLRRPLTPISFMSEQLAAGQISSEGARLEYYDALVRQSVILGKQVDLLFDLAKVEAGASPFSLEAINILDFLADIKQEFQRSTSPRGHQIKLRVDENMPLIYVDRNALFSIVWNLLDNAVKFSPDCFIVEVEASLSVGNAAIRIRDYGEGISESDQARIFQKFGRGKYTGTNNVRGTGLGLFVIQRMVVARGGAIRLESKVGEGTTFTVLLPIGGIRCHES
jgi:signal transduction histidine kinase